MISNREKWVWRVVAGVIYAVTFVTILSLMDGPTWSDEDAS